MNWLGMGVKQYVLAKSTQKERKKKRSAAADRLVLIEIGHTNRLAFLGNNPALRCAYIAFPSKLACANRLLFATL